MSPTRSWIPTLLWPALAALATGCVQSVPLPAQGLRPLPLLTARGTLGAESLQPRLEWQAFPRPEDLKADKKGSLGAARSVTYELRIWRAADAYPGECAQGRCWFPSELIYARAGLAEPAHTLETPLAPNTLYLWTIRARFVLNGKSRVTQWGVMIASADPPALRDTGIPSLRYYRFETPPAPPPPAAN